MGIGNRRIESWKKKHKYLENTELVLRPPEIPQIALQTNLGLVREKHALNVSQ
jgi:hypothetical protein